MNKPIDPIIPIRERLREAGIQENTIRRFVDKPPFPTAIVGTRVMAKKSVIEAYLADLEAQLTP